MMGNIMIKSGIEEEINIVLNAIGGDSRIGKKYLKYGFGFGGPCLPRDNRALGYFAKNLGMELNLPLTIDNFNKEHADFIKNYFIQRNPDKSVPFVMDYITYKKGTNILEESQQYQLCIDLLDEGYTLHVIEIDEIANKLSKVSESYENRLKFFKSGTNPIGYKINL
jgi:UDP-glucose 6-dehydrogenase